MKKVIYEQFGGVDVLKMADVEKPALKETSILVKVKAVSINPLDWKIREGEMKLNSGKKFPKGVGMDFSGIVENVGTSIRSFKTGDTVFGTVDVFTGGALAEYIAVTEKDIALKPENISFEQAAAMPIVGSAALQIFDKLVKIQKGSEVLINGASGGIGMFAIQMAKMKGAVITAVVGSKGIKFAEKWGSDVAIDYNKTDILKDNKQYDAVIDLSGKIPFSAAKQIMKPSASYVNTVPGIKEIIGSFFHNIFSKRKYRVLLLSPQQGYLKSLAGYAANGMQIEVSKVYPMSSFKEAYTETPKGGIIGKAVFTL